MKISKTIAREIKINGVVQAVGFRPFVYRIATDNDLIGWVKNLGEAGVKVFLQGESSDIKKFLQDLKEKNPPLARIEKIKSKEVEADPEIEEFEIVKSSSGSSGSGTIPPTSPPVMTAWRTSLTSPVTAVTGLLLASTVVPVSRSSASYLTTGVGPPWTISPCATTVEANIRIPVIAVTMLRR